MISSITIYFQNPNQTKTKFFLKLSWLSLTIILSCFVLTFLKNLQSRLVSTRNFRPFLKFLPYFASKIPVVILSCLKFQNFGSVSNCLISIKNLSWLWLEKLLYLLQHDISYWNLMYGFWVEIELQNWCFWLFIVHNSKVCCKWVSQLFSSILHGQV